VLSPHPSAARCINETVKVMRDAGAKAGLPAEAIGCMTTATIEGTEALMKHKMTAVILATGGIGLVRAAYSSGKPAFGVGPGNVPVFIERSADVPKAVQDIFTGKCLTTERSALPNKQSSSTRQLKWPSANNSNSRVVTL